MLKQDVLIFGAIAGIIGNIVKLILVFILHSIGFIQYSFGHIAAGYFVQLNDVNSLPSLINGYFSDFIYAGILGIIIYIILRNTSFYLAEVKGVIFGGAIHLMNNGILLFSQINSVHDLPAQTHLMLLFPSMLFGLITCIILKRYHG